ncbi:hypothetical protein ACMFMF_001294 [Clarireedia jacksonii]
MAVFSAKSDTTSVTKSTLNVETANGSIYFVPILQNKPQCRRKTAYWSKPDGDLERVWTDELVESGFSCHYIMHTVLALSALQLFSEDQSKTKWYMQATAHQDAAIKLARPLFQQPIAENSGDTFAFSAVTAIFALKEPLLRPAELLSKPFDPVTELLDSFHLARGLRHSLDKFPQEKTSEWKASAGAVAEERERARSVEYPQLQALKDAISEHCAHEEKNHCLDAAIRLFDYLSLLQTTPNTNRFAYLIHIWPQHISHEYIELCYNGHSAALAVLAHYSVLIGQRQKIWFFQGWPKVLLEHITDILDDTWYELLQWPKAMIDEVNFLTEKDDATFKGDDIVMEDTGDEENLVAVTPESCTSPGQNLET